MSAEVELLREAARVMRERAQKAVHNDRLYWRSGKTQMTKSPVVIDDDERPSVLVETFAERYEDVNAHLAGFGSPAVALAVADWLDGEADLHDAVESAKGKVPEGWALRVTSSTLPQAVAVARAYLGGAS